MFSRYVKFELKCLVKNPKNIVMLTLIFIGLFGYYGFNAYMADKTKNQRLVMHQTDIKEKISVDGNYQRRLNPDKINKAVMKLITDDFVYVNRLTVAIGAENDERWGNELAVTIGRDEAILAGFYNWRDIYYSETPAENIADIEKSQMDFPNSDLPSRYKSYTEASLIKNIQKNRYISNMNIQPVFSEYDMTGWQFIYRMTTKLWAIAIPVLVVLLCSDSFSAEKDAGSYKFLLLQPMSRVGVYMAKLVGSLIMCLGVVFVSLIIMLGISSVQNSAGESGYPVEFEIIGSNPAMEAVKYDGNGSISEFLASLDPGTVMPSGFVAVSDYMIKASLLIILYIIFMVSFIAIISVIADNSVSAVAVSLGIVFVSTMIGRFAPQGRFVWNPIGYADVSGLVTGAWSGFYWYPVVWALVLIVAGAFLFSKKDIIC